MAKKPTTKSPAAAAPIAPATPPAPAPAKRLVGKAAPARKPKPAAAPVAPPTVPPPQSAASTAKPKAAAKKVSAAPVAKAAPSPARKTASRKSKPASTPVEPKPITHEDICLRAYLISERRQAEGIYAEPHDDWVEAERQLRAEAGLAS